MFLRFLGYLETLGCLDTEKFLCRKNKIKTKILPDVL